MLSLASSATIRASFNAHVDTVRVVTLLSPT